MEHCSSRGIGVIPGDLCQEMFLVSFIYTQIFFMKVLHAHLTLCLSLVLQLKRTLQQISILACALCPLSSELCCFIYSAWQIGWVGKPSSWHTMSVPSHPTLDQMCTGCSLRNGVIELKLVRALKWIQLFHFHSCLKSLPIIYPYSSECFNCT